MTGKIIEHGLDTLVLLLPQVIKPTVHIYFGLFILLVFAIHEPL